MLLKNLKIEMSVVITSSLYKWLMTVFLVISTDNEIHV